MALDFNNLPPEVAVPDKPPSPIVWTIVFFVIVLGGVFSVLLFWPADTPTRTSWYWTCVGVYPPGIAAFVVLRRFSSFEGRRLDAIAHNDARQQYLTERFERESRPLAILGAAYRFSSDEAEDDFNRIQDGTAKLVSRTLPKPDTSSMKVCWFEKPSEDENGRPFATDHQRQKALLAWAFDALIAQLGATLQNLPKDFPLAIHIALPDDFKTNASRIDEAQKCWRDAWKKAGFSPRDVRMPCDADVMKVDAWLDEINLDREQKARLYVQVRLSPIIRSAPNDGSAEVASALLLAAPTTQRKFNLAPIAWLHRPTGTGNANHADHPVNTSLERALQWGGIEPESVTQVWQSGLTSGAANATRTTLVRTGITLAPVVLDELVGHAAEAAPWLGIACAAKAAMQSGTAQLVATTDSDGLCFCVVRSCESIVGRPVRSAQVTT